MNSILVIGYVWPEPNSSAAGTRMIQLLDFFQAEGYSVTFATTALETIHIEYLKILGIKTQQIELNNSSFDDFIQNLQPEIVVFDRFMMEEQFGWRVSNICPDALKILDTEDLHFLRNFRENAFKNKNPDFILLKESELAKREIASIYRCDLSLIISESEMRLLEEQFNIPQNLLLYLPFLLNPITTDSVMQLPGFEDRQHFISIGNFRHPPNVDAVFYLKQEIWPFIQKQLPKAQMHIYGAYSTARITQLHSPKENFLIKGWAKSAPEAVKNAKISLAPLRFGAGLKGKLIEAMQCGTPTVTTNIGAEGMHGNLCWNGSIKNTPEDIADAAVSLYTSKIKWKLAQKNGFNIINSRYSKSDFHKILHSRIKFLKEELKMHRQNNFIGAMLMHHRTKSTYFLSKYIEIKNKLLQLKNSEKQNPTGMSS
ncbi:MAG: glycosyltransferase family 4 protein [Gillisia sp.]|nr:glycosyltransferase family 4 protein [Gillisia sp.]